MFSGALEVKVENHVVIGNGLLISKMQKNKISSDVNYL